MTPDINKFKEKLEQEKRAVEKDLGEVAQVNPDNPAAWETTPVPGEGDPEMHDEVADFLEDLEEREATEEELADRLTKINAALERIAAGTYGTCHICNEPIEVERLEANPAATTCKQHRERE